MNETTPCPCTSGLAYAECCKPYISGTRQPPSQRHDYDEAGAERWARESEWEQLEILGVDDDAADPDRGNVEFRAHYRRRGEKLVHHERAEFRRSGDRWYFYDGRMVGIGQVRRDTPKVGRNDPCPCGSGRKYKKCCG